MHDAPARERADGRRRDAVIIAAVVALVAVPSLFTRDLWNPDEPRYMEVAREMVLLPDYVIPHLNGEVYMEKPPLFFWLAGLLWRAGLGSDAGRLLSLASVYGTLLLVCFFARSRIGPRAGLLAAAIALTSLLLLRFTAIGVLDPLLTLFVTAALLGGYNAFHAADRRRARLWWLAGYAAMGLGTLTKGPVGFLVPALVLCAYAVADRKNVRLGGAAHALGLAVFAAIVLAWLMPAVAAGGPDYTRTILVKQNFGRAVGSWSHRHAFHYYLLRWPAAFFPWSFILPLAGIAAVRRWRELDSPVRFAALWLVVPFVFFSFISGKRMNYVVPAVPAAGLLCAWYLGLAGPGEGRLVKSETWLFRIAFAASTVFVIALMAALLGGPAVVQKVYSEAQFGREIAAFLTPARRTVGLAVFAVPLALSLWGVVSHRADVLCKAAVLAAAVVLACPGTDLFLLPAANKVKSGRHFAATVNRHAGGATALYLYGDDFSGVYNLWTGRVCIPRLVGGKELRKRLSDGATLVVSDVKHLRSALDPADVERYEVAREHVGHRVMVLLSGRTDCRRTVVRHPKTPRASE